MNHIDVRIAFNEMMVETGNKTTALRRANIVMPVPSFLAMVQILQLHAQKLMTSAPQVAEKAQAHLQAAIESAQKTK